MNDSKWRKLNESDRFHEKLDFLNCEREKLNICIRWKLFRKLLLIGMWRNLFDRMVVVALQGRFIVVQVCVNWRLQFIQLLFHTYFEISLNLYISAIGWKTSKMLILLIELAIFQNWNKYQCRVHEVGRIKSRRKKLFILQRRI